MKTLTTLLATILAGNIAYAKSDIETRTYSNQCAESFAEEAFRLRQEPSMFKDMLSKQTRKDFGISVPIVGVAGFFVTAPLSWGVKAGELKRAAGLEQIAALVEREDSRKAQKAINDLYSDARKDFTITDEQFQNFILNQFDLNSFCAKEWDLVLSEKGRQMAGNQSFFMFMYQTHGNPEWKEFWDDSTNFENQMVSKLLDKDERKLLVLKALRAAGYLEERMR